MRARELTNRQRKPSGLSWPPQRARGIADDRKVLSDALIRLHSSLLFLVIGLYLVLNYGFMQVRVPPVAGGGIPVGELVLLFSLAIIDYSKVLPRLSAAVFLLPFLIWWTYGSVRAVMGVPEYGAWALRDATHVIESLFLIVGFAVASNTSALELFFRWLPKLLLVACIYALLRPISEALQGLSPTLVAAGGHEVPLFFNYASTYTLLVMSIAYLLIFKSRDSIGYTAVAILLFAYAVIVFNARTLYLQIIAIIVFLALYRRAFFDKWAFGFLLLCVILLAMPMVGVQYAGRTGAPVSVQFYVDHFLTIFGVEREGVESAAGGFDQRIGWWSDLYGRWTENRQNFLFGLGYGFPLVDFVAIGPEYAEEGQVAREPHNSYVSITARLGLVGIVAFAWMHVLLIAAWRRAYSMCTRMRWREGQNRLLIFMVFFLSVLVVAVGEDGFEKPYFAIPYFFFWGMVLGMGQRWKDLAFIRSSREAAKG